MTFLWDEDDFKLFYSKDKPNMSRAILKRDQGREGTNISAASTRCVFYPRDILADTNPYGFYRRLCTRYTLALFFLQFYFYFLFTFLPFSCNSLTYIHNTMHYLDIVLFKYRTFEIFSVFFYNHSKFSSFDIN